MNDIFAPSVYVCVLIITVQNHGKSEVEEVVQFYAFFISVIYYMGK